MSKAVVEQDGVCRRWKVSLIPKSDSVIMADTIGGHRVVMRVKTTASGFDIKRGRAIIGEMLRVVSCPKGCTSYSMHRKKNDDDDMFDHLAVLKWRYLSKQEILLEVL